MAKQDLRELSGSFVLASEEHAYFVGSLLECAAYAKGYNEHASGHAETVEFEMLPADQVVVRP